MKKDAEFLQIRATPRASRNRIELDLAGRIKVFVTSPPEDGRANQAICELVAKFLGVPKSSVEIASGHTSREKSLRLGSISAEEAWQLIQDKLAQPKLMDS